MKEKCFNNKMKILKIAVISINIILILGTYALDSYETKSHVLLHFGNNIDLYNIIEISFSVFILSIFFMIFTSTRLKKVKGGRLTAFLFSLILLAFSVQIVGMKLWGLDYKYQTYQSPNGENQFLIVDKSFLHDVDQWIYQRESTFFIKRVESLPLGKQEDYDSYKEYEEVSRWTEDNYQIFWHNDNMVDIIELLSGKSIVIEFLPIQSISK